ncbi:hypothetical protein [Paenibacillus guangzhouensis]|uniref:hypothetical protein n=1 Tax=Paenibacillus guangzhouensis TaxID=1473112 RepID=UPI001266C860|nr:hypothetical protein [Paenibacillus guangzhouensis]
MEAYYGCVRCMNRRVRLYTSDGRSHEGTIVKVDRNNVYLKQEGKGARTSGFGFGFGFNDDILTLSLFTLLAIALI